MEKFTFLLVIALAFMPLAIVIFMFEREKKSQRQPERKIERALYPQQKIDDDVHGNRKLIYPEGKVLQSKKFVQGK